LRRTATRDGRRSRGRQPGSNRIGWPPDAPDQRAPEKVGTVGRLRNVEHLFVASRSDVHARLRAAGLLPAATESTQCSSAAIPTEA
jgi:hypothetical protein